MGVICSSVSAEHLLNVAVGLLKLYDSITGELSQWLWHDDSTINIVIVNIIIIIILKVPLGVKIPRVNRKKKANYYCVQGLK